MKAPEQITLARKLGENGLTVMGEGETMSMGYVDATSYTRTDLAKAMVAAAYEAAAEKSRQSCVECGGTGERDTGGTMPWGAPAFVGCDCDTRVLDLTPTDAKAALDRIVQEAVRDALQVKPLVWVESDGFLEGQFVWSYDDAQSMWIVKNKECDHYTLCESITMEFAPVSPVLGCFATLGDAKAEAEARHERRILSALKGGEA